MCRHILLCVCGCGWVGACVCVSSQLLTSLSFSPFSPKPFFSRCLLNIKRVGGARDTEKTERPSAEALAEHTHRLERTLKAFSLHLTFSLYLASSSLSHGFFTLWFASDKERTCPAVVHPYTHTEPDVGVRLFCVCCAPRPLWV